MIDLGEPKNAQKTYISLWKQPPFDYSEADPTGPAGTDSKCWRKKWDKKQL